MGLLVPLIHFMRSSLEWISRFAYLSDPNILPAQKLNPPDDAFSRVDEHRPEKKRRDS